MLVMAKYDVGEQLYESNSSEVYRATRKADGKYVILKVLLPPLPPAYRVARFKREFERLRRHALYQRILRPMVPHSMRDRFRYALLPRTTVEHSKPSAQTVTNIETTLAAEMTQLARIMERPAPLWDNPGTTGARRS